MSIEDRLADLGIDLPPVAKPVAAYVPAIQVGDQISTSGQLPLVSGSLPMTGLVGDQISQGTLRGRPGWLPSMPWLLQPTSPVESTTFAGSSELSSTLPALPTSPLSQRWPMVPPSCSERFSVTPGDTFAAPSVLPVCRWGHLSRSSSRCRSERPVTPPAAGSGSWGRWPGLFASEPVPRMGNTRRKLVSTETTVW